MAEPVKQTIEGHYDEIWEKLQKIAEEHNFSVEGGHYELGIMSLRKGKRKTPLYVQLKTESEHEITLRAAPGISYLAEVSSISENDIHSLIQNVRKGSA